MDDEWEEDWGKMPWMGKWEKERASERETHILGCLRIKTILACKSALRVGPADGGVCCLTTQDEREREKERKKEEEKRIEGKGGKGQTK